MTWRESRILVIFALDLLCGTSSRTNATDTTDDEFHTVQEDQNKGRAAAKGFRCDTTEEEVETLLTSTIVDAGMSKDKIQLQFNEQCFFTYSRNLDRFMASSSRSGCCSRVPRVFNESCEVLSGNRTFSICRHFRKQSVQSALFIKFLGEFGTITRWTFYKMLLRTRRKHMNQFSVLRLHCPRGQDYREQRTWKTVDSLCCHSGNN